jgi:hypothetical protein
MLISTYISVMNMHHFLVLNILAMPQLRQSLWLSTTMGQVQFKDSNCYEQVTLELVFICTTLKIIISLKHHFLLSLLNNSYDKPAYPNYNPVMSLTHTQHLDRLRVKNYFLVTILWILNLNMSNSVTRGMNYYNNYVCQEFTITLMT